MAKIGVSLKIDVTKIDKERLFKGEKGTYLDATVFIDLGDADQFGNHGMITQSWKDKPKEENGAILGNSRIFWRDQSEPTPSQQQPQPAPSQDFDENIPF